MLYVFALNWASNIDADMHFLDVPCESDDCPLIR